MDPRLIVPLDPASPWASWARPDIRHCEANLAGWIAAPADAWSNLAYAAVGLFLMKRTCGRARALAFVAFVIAVFSFAFHASYTAAGQVLDFASMFVLTGWILALGAARAGWTANDALNAVWATIVGLSLTVFGLFRAHGIPVQTIMMAHALAVSAQELWLWRRGKGAPSYKSFWIAQALMIAAYACWHVDHMDSFCAPNDHWFQWHAVWHVITAIAFVPLAEFYGAIAVD